MDVRRGWMERFPGDDRGIDSPAFNATILTLAETRR
jgi:hypothetical protein